MINYLAGWRAQSQPPFKEAHKPSELTTAFNPTTLLLLPTHAENDAQDQTQPELPI
jgi:hypothetical protein